MKKFFSVSFFLLIAVLVMGQSKLSPKTRNYMLDKSQQVVAPLESRLYQTCSVAERDYVSAFVEFYDDVDLNLLETYEVIVESEFTGIVTAKIPSDQLENLASEPSIKYIEMAAPIFPRMEYARGLSNVNAVHEGQLPLNAPYTGKDVVVGIIDVGFQYHHINFYDQSGNLRVKRVWNQNGTGTAPSGYTTGVEYTTTSAIETAAYDRRSDDVGHATHVAGIAAGSDKNNGNPNYGVAYESDLVFVSYNQYASGSTDLLNAVRYVYDYATSVNKPAVINLSLGSHTGPHDGTSTFDRVCDQLQGEGRLMVGAAGNEGSDRFHVSKEFSATDTVLKTFVQYNTTYKVSMIDIWGSEGTDYSVQVVVYNKTTREIVDSSAVYRAQTSTSTSIRLSGYSGSISLSSGINANNNKANVSIDYQLSSITDPNVIGIVITADSGEVHAWADDYYSWLSSLYRSGWTMGDNNNSVGEIGGTGKRIITAGSYTSQARSGYGQTLNAISTFSSKGPTADGRIKPDITAPGSCLLSSVPGLTSVVNSSYYDGGLVNNVNGTNYYYGYMQGTSMSSPYVCGVLALWLQADPTLTPERVREIFAETSLRDSYTGNDLPNNTWGYGKIDAYTGMASVVSQTTGLVIPTVEESQMVYPNPTYGEFQIAFLSEENDVRMDVIDMTGSIIKTVQLGDLSRGEVRGFDLSSWSDGVYLIKITSDKQVKTHRLIVRK